MQRSFRPVRDVSAHDLLLEADDDADVSSTHLLAPWLGGFDSPSCTWNEQ